jgi:ABC-type Fe3+/spermidine/putrescine transport system ATPase subunit
MNLGTIQQIGDPPSIYTRPQNTFVSNFIGTSTFIKSNVRSTSIELLGSSFEFSLKTSYEGEAILAIRPEEVNIVDKENGILQGEIQFVTFLGDFINYEVTLADASTLQINEYLKETSLIRKVGDKVGLIFDTKRINLYSADGKESLL